MNVLSNLLHPEPEVARALRHPPHATRINPTRVIMLPPGPLSRAAIAARHAMRPGTYIRLRREKSGWEHSELAVALARHPEDRPAIRADLELLEDESDGALPPASLRPLVLRLAEMLDLDVDIYFALVGFAHDPDSGLPCPRICTGCGCTWNHACMDTQTLTPCHWRDDGEDRCSTCPPAPQS